jgi:hypothetical protein
MVQDTSLGLGAISLCKGVDKLAHARPRPPTATRKAITLLVRCNRTRLKIPFKMMYWFPFRFDCRSGSCMNDGGCEVCAFQVAKHRTSPTQTQCYFYLL